MNLCEKNLSVQYYFAERKYRKGFPKMAINLRPIPCVDDKLKIR